MIHSTLHGPAKRRIALIRLPRPQQARLGMIRDGLPTSGAVAWTTISDEPADTSQSWLAFQLQRAANYRQTTPGTFEYNPAPLPTDDGGVPAPWDSWAVSPDCIPSIAPGAAIAAAPGSGPDSFFRVLALLGGAAATVYLFKNLTE